MRSSGCSHQNLADGYENFDQREVTARLKYAIENAGGNKAVSERASVPLSTLNGYIAGRDMKGSTAARIARACGVSLEWLFFGAELQGESAVNLSANSSIAVIDYYNSPALSEFGSHTPESQPEKIAMSHHFLERHLGLPPENVIALKVKGDSMEPTLRTGDTVLLDTCPNNHLEGLHALLLDGILLIKRLSMTGNARVTISSDNPLYPPQIMDRSLFRWGLSDYRDGIITVVGRVAYRIQALL